MLLANRLPTMSQGNTKFRPERFLLLCYFDHRNISTIYENIAYLQKLSKFEIEILNLYGFNHPFNLPSCYNLNDYTGIIFHNALTYNVDTLLELDANLSIKFCHYNGIKIILKQDEQYKTSRTAQYIGDNHFDAIFTCLPESEWEKVYPKNIVGHVQFFQMLAGYVTPNLRQDISAKFNYKRTIDVGYRGSLQPLEFGLLCYEKRSIGYNFLNAAQNSQFICDISSRWEDRFYGDDWFKFLCRCKAVLGVESGASIFDFNGEVTETVSKFKKQYPGSDEDPEYAVKLLEQLKKFEGKVYHNQISPRHFEAAATKTLQIMFEGTYSGIFHPWKHYVPLKRDFSNFKEIETILHDEKRRTEIVENAYRDIIHSPRFWIEHFVEQFDKMIQDQLNKKTWVKASIKLPSFDQNYVNVLLLCPHHPKQDPRISWIQKNSDQNLIIHVLALNALPDAETSITGNALSGYTIIIPKLHSSVRNWKGFTSESSLTTPGIEEALFLEWVYTLPKIDREKIFGIAAVSKNYGNDDDETKELSLYFLNSAYSLLTYASKISGIKAIIACDLDTLLPAAILKSRFQIPLFYDAHEFWPDSCNYFVASSFQFWHNLEQKLIKNVDFAFTVTTNIAKYMSRIYRKQFEYLPNCEPITALNIFETTTNNKEKYSLKIATNEVAFLVQAVFTTGRGFELLINWWCHTDRKAKLFLRGPKGIERDNLITLASNSGLLNERIFFPDPVDESELVVAASCADVGIIPYEPSNLNNRYCGPNKLSQYMAASIPIFSNKLEYIESILKHGECGLVADFTNREDFINTVNKLTQNQELRKKLGQNAKTYFKNYYNWNNRSKKFYSTLYNTAKKSIIENHEIIFTQPIPDNFENNNKNIHDTNIQDTIIPTQITPSNSETKNISSHSSFHSMRYLITRMLWRILPKNFRAALRKNTSSFLKYALQIIDR